MHLGLKEYKLDGWNVASLLSIAICLTRVWSLLDDGRSFSALRSKAKNMGLVDTSHIILTSGGRTIHSMRPVTYLSSY
jgi:hypothetical protein